MSNTTFDNCWIDADGPLCEYTAGGVTFRMRQITAGEHQRIMAACRVSGANTATPTHEQLAGYAKTLGKPVTELTTDDVAAFTDAMRQVQPTLDATKMMLLTVTAALGAWGKVGTEGWTSTKPVTEVTVAQLRPEVVTQLYNAHAGFF